jgi:hypothetical protein
VSVEKVVEGEVGLGRQYDLTPAVGRKPTFDDVEKLGRVRQKRFDRRSIEKQNFDFRHLEDSSQDRPTHQRPRSASYPVRMMRIGQQVFS